MTPTICVWFICRNEARDIPRALRSVESFADHIVIVDTGSTDETEAIVRSTVTAPLTYERYTGASEQVGNGEWRLLNFSAARNRAIELSERSGCSHIFWMDSDDEVMTPLAVRRAKYMPVGAYGVWISLGQGLRQVHYRLWNVGAKIRFQGWVHEYPVIPPGLASPVLNDVCVNHDATPHDSAGETSNARNLRILEKQYAAEPDARTAFYLANTHKDGGRPAEAIAWYEKRLGYGDAFRDEYLFALLYLARCFAAIGDETGARNAISYGLELAPDWQEFRLELARAAYRAKDYHEAVKIAKMALDRPQPPTVLWREPGAYSDQPARLISWCYEHVGNFEAAFSWAEVAGQRIGARDDEWIQRTLRLRGQMQAPPAAPAIVKRARQRIALHRPGAIGDILMTLNLLPAFLEANPDADVHYFCAAQYAQEDALGGIIAQAGAVPMDAAGLPAWRKSYDRVIDLVGYPLAEGYPEKPMRRHLLEYFGEEMGLSWPGFGVSERLSAPQFMLPRPVARWTEPYITLQMTAGWSKYKQWSEDRWRRVADRMPEVAFMWIRESQRRTLADVIGIFANARMHLGIDSFCNHLTNYLWTDENGARRVPGVILWGSTQASAAGYPDNINLSAGLECQPCFRENPAISRMPRGPCINPHRPTYDDDTPWACMEAISVDQVVEAVREMWERTSNANAQPKAIIPT